MCILDDTVLDYCRHTAAGYTSSTVDPGRSFRPAGEQRSNGDPLTGRMSS